MIKEIGSEFAFDDSFVNKSFKNDFGFDNIVFLLSGRNAITYAILDAKRNNKIVTAYLPSYCCKSMIDPFIHNSIKVEFYDVNYKDNRLTCSIDVNKEVDVFFAMNYFGYQSTNMDDFIVKFKEKKVIVIEDITHSLFQKRKCCKMSDYYVCSLRKWMPIISGAFLAKNGEITKFSLKEPSNIFVQNKLNAMKKKKDYLTCGGEKKDFLDLFKKANQYFDDQIELTQIDAFSFEVIENYNLSELKKRRSSNAKMIEEKYLSNVMLNFQDGDCPLFVPLFLEDRESLFKEMLQKQVYLPKHWAQPNYGESSNIYSHELSFVCDQRYEERDLIKKNF